MRTSGSYRVNAAHDLEEVMRGLRDLAAQHIDEMTPLRMKNVKTAIHAMAELYVELGKPEFKQLPKEPVAKDTCACDPACSASSGGDCKCDPTCDAAADPIVCR